MIIHVFGEVQGPASTGDLHDEYLKGELKAHKHISLYESNTLQE